MEMQVYGIMYTAVKYNDEITSLERQLFLNVITLLNMIVSVG